MPEIPWILWRGLKEPGEFGQEKNGKRERREERLKERGKNKKRNKR